MSKFVTSLPVAIDDVKRALPPGSSVLSVTLEANAVHIVWDNSRLKTPYTFPVDYPLAKLMAGADNSAPTENTENAEKTVDKRRKRGQ